MQISEKVDWLSLTFDVHHKTKDILPQCLQSHMIRIKSPIPVYKHCYEIGCNAKLLSGGGDRLGTHLILSGKTLDNARGQDPNFINEIYDIVLSTKANVSRMDIALDVIGSDTFTVDAVRERHLKGECVTQLKGSKFIGEDRNTETFYIGNIKSKNRKLRVYNKAIEQGISGEKWVRVEYEKRKNAKAMLRTLMESKTGIREIINSVVSFPNWDTWTKILGTEVTSIGRGLESDKFDSARLDWIIKSALPAIAREIVKSASDYNTDINDAPATRIINQILEREVNKILAQS